MGHSFNNIVVAFKKSIVVNVIILVISENQRSFPESPVLAWTIIIIIISNVDASFISSDVIVHWGKPLRQPILPNKCTLYECSLSSLIKQPSGMVA